MGAHGITSSWAWVCCAISAMGCDEVFSLDRPPGYDDDAPVVRSCPTDGEAPRFTKLPVSFTTMTFPNYYSFDEAGTFAVGDRTSVGMVEGPIDTDIFDTFVLPKDVGDYVFSPRLAPEGDELFALVRTAALQYSLRLYSRSGPRAYARGPTTSLVISPAEEVSTPSRRMPERRIIITNNTGTELREHAERSGTWPLVDTYDLAALGVPWAFAYPHLSPDGLRLVFAIRANVGRPIYYSSRGSLTERFGSATQILQLSGDAELNHPALTQDCSRLYFAVFPGVTYVE